MSHAVFWGVIQSDERSEDSKDPFWPPAISICSSPAIEKSVSGPQTRPRLYGLPRGAVLLLLFTSGLVSMGMEVVWIRQFTPYLGNVVYAFAAILAPRPLKPWQYEMTSPSSSTFCCAAGFISTNDQEGFSATCGQDPRSVLKRK